MRSRSRFATTVLSLVATASIGTAASGDRLGHHRDFAERLERHAAELKLDDKTRSQVETLAATSRANAHVLFERTRKERDRLRDLLAEQSPDLDAVMAAADVIAGLEADALKNRLRTTVEIRSQLSSEQRAMLAARQNKARDTHQWRRAARVRDVQRACASEISASCPDSARSPHSVRRCLMASEAVSPTCAEMLFDREYDRQHRRHWTR